MKKEFFNKDNNKKKEFVTPKQTEIEQTNLAKAKDVLDQKIQNQYQHKLELIAKKMLQLDKYYDPKIKAVQKELKYINAKFDPQLFQKIENKIAKLERAKATQVDLLNYDRKIAKQKMEDKLSLTQEHQSTIKKQLRLDNKTRIQQIRKANNTPRKGDPATKNDPGLIIQGRNVDKFYETGAVATHVLKKINFDIEVGDFVIIYGQSGSGKSTLLNLISGLDRVTNGDVIVNNTNLAFLSNSQLTKFRRDNVGFIFQDYNLLSNLTGYENAETGAFLQKDSTKRLDIKQLFYNMNLEDVMTKYPSEMSGGQQQRVSIIRAISKNPKIVFADEPTGALDEEISISVLKILQSINEKYKTTIIMVSHNPVIAQLAKQLIKIKNGNITKVTINKHPKRAEELQW